MTVEKEKKAYKVIGTRPVRHDGTDKVTGRALYGADIRLPGMLYGAVLRSPHAHARIRSIDVSQAAAIPGVRGIVTSADLPDLESKITQLGEGVINLRGTVIPILDLRLRFELPKRPATGNSRLLIVKMAGQIMGVEVDDVTEVVTVPVKDIKPPPAVTSCGIDEYLIGVCLVRESLIMLLNLDKLLTRRETDELGTFDARSTERVPQ